MYGIRIVLLSLRPPSLAGSLAYASLYPGFQEKGRPDTSDWSKNLGRGQVCENTPSRQLVNRGDEPLCQVGHTYGYRGRVFIEAFSALFRRAMIRNVPHALLQASRAARSG